MELTVLDEWPTTLMTTSRKETIMLVEFILMCILVVIIGNLL